ncbi:hypothetical protein GQF03_10200 [Sneathiella chungangensis]|uniref:Recombinase family protein n=1 Tax=Sneathiella chungangensis TaxID=1418234 RepID=A0A845MGC1_9PROT|nr:hypothetical protein [Sneathiella chungangensis]
MNVLLSFAQFEREVTAERIRDKIAASKKKGMWMGGNLPLGYDVVDRKLVINKEEAATVRLLFDLYIELGTVRLLKAEADRLGIVTKKIIRKDESVTGGKPFLRGNLYRLLSNPLYIGLIPHKGETYSGQHEAIIDQETWDQVQHMMSSNRRERSSPTNVKAPFLLTGLVFDEEGEPLYQAQASKNGKRYRYYISKKLVSHPKSDSNGWRLPAQTVESMVIGLIHNLLQDRQRLMDLLELANRAPSLLEILKVKADELAGELIDENIEYQQSILRTIIHRVGFSTDTISFDLSRNALFNLLEIIEAIPTDSRNDIITLNHTVTMQRQGMETKLIIESATKARQPDPDLCRLIATARNWFDQLASGEVKSVKEIAIREKIFDTEITRMLPLAFLAPSIIEDILKGRQPETLTVRSLKRLSPLPTDWNEQRKRLGFHQ